MYLDLQLYCAFVRHRAMNSLTTQNAVNIHKTMFHYRQNNILTRKLESFCLISRSAFRTEI